MLFSPFSSTSTISSWQTPSRSPSPPHFQDYQSVEAWYEHHQIDQYPVSPSKKLKYKRLQRSVELEEIFDTAFQELVDKKKLSIAVGCSLKTWCLSTENDPPEQYKDVVKKHHLTHMFSKNYTVTNHPNFMSEFVSKIRDFGVEVTASYKVESYPKNQTPKSYLNTMTLQVTKNSPSTYRSYWSSLSSIANSEIFSIYDS